MSRIKSRDKLVASDLMTKKPYIVQSSMTIDEASDFFLDHKFTSAPVIGTNGNILGILDEFTLVKMKLVLHVGDDKKDKISRHDQLFLPIVTVSETAPILDVMKLMIRSPNHRLFVVNQLKALVGIISPKDILRYLGSTKKTNSPPKTELEQTQAELDKTLLELKRTKNRLDIFQDIVMENPIMIHSVDAMGQIIMANKKMHESLGYEMGELLQKTIFDIYTPDAHEKATKGLQKIVKEGSHKNIYTTMMKKNGEKLRVDVASAALHDEKKQFMATISVSRELESDVLLRALHSVINSDENKP